MWLYLGTEFKGLNSTGRVVLKEKALYTYTQRVGHCRHREKLVVLRPG